MESVSTWGLSLLILVGGLLWLRAWRGLARTSLGHAWAWAVAAWLAWVGLAVEEHTNKLGASSLHYYIALCLTGCAGMAVLGARRPGAGAWNFVVGGLLAVLMLPVAEGFGQPRLHPIHISFLASILALACLNYLPTRFGLLALGGGLSCAVQFAKLMDWKDVAWESPVGVAVLLSLPWLGWLFWKWWPRSGTEIDRTWHDFRDRIGLVWGLRVREQFNRSAANAGWTVGLGWQGLRYQEGTVTPDPDEILATLHAVLKRFGVEEKSAIGERRVYPRRTDPTAGINPAARQVKPQ